MSYSEIHQKIGIIWCEVCQSATCAVWRNSLQENIIFYSDVFINQLTEKDRLLWTAVNHHTAQTATRKADSCAQRWAMNTNARVRTFIIILTYMEQDPPCCRGDMWVVIYSWSDCWNWVATKKRAKKSVGLL